MSVILITGANGQLGSELKEVSRSYYGYDFLFTDLDTIDISDPDRTSKYIAEYNPDWIINCAAYNLVDKAESEPETAMKINAHSVTNLVNAIKGTNARFIHISTDYVFSGQACEPYTETDETGPQGAYGRSKLAGEKAALMHPGTMVIRTSWLYSQFGSNFVKTILSKGREKGLLKVVFDQTGSPTYARDLAEAIMTIVSGVIRNKFAFTAGLYHYSDEGVCSWYDFATEVIREAKIDCRIIPVRSSEFLSVAKRPFYSVLDKTKIKENYELEIPHWRTSLGKCLELLNK